MGISGAHGRLSEHSHDFGEIDMLTVFSCKSGTQMAWSIRARNESYTPSNP